MKFSKSIMKIISTILLITIILTSFSVQAVTYSDYQAVERTDIEKAADFSISLKDCISENVDIVSEYKGFTGLAAVIKSGETATFKMNVAESGLYNIKVTYLAGLGNATSISRGILIDDVIPFDESALVAFPQPWTDSTGRKYDINENEIRAKQKPFNGWMEYYAYDSSGKNSEPLKYYLSSGEHSITFSAGEEEFVISKIEFVKPAAVPTYSEVLKTYRSKGYKNATESVVFEAEENAIRSDRSMLLLSDRTSPTVNPYSAGKVVYNSIGGTQWKLAEQWIEWNFTVKEDGLYKIGTHFRQADKTGDISVRECYIDNQLPFAEAANITFGYSNSWQFKYFADKKNEPYLFYLTEGKHTIRLKVGLGEIAESIIEAQQLLEMLNSIYRRIVVITGSSPDMYRDYQLDELIPEVFDDMKIIDEQLLSLQDSVSKADEGSNSISAVTRLRLQISQMLDDSDVVSSILTSFQENISAFGTWINNRKEQPLTLDNIIVASPSEKDKTGEVNFFSLVFHYLKQFILSFTSDYNSVGVVDEECDKGITVWMSQGRDQSLILKQLIGDEFTPETDIAVNLQLVTPTALLPSVISGTSPDVYMGIGEAEVINLALRDAVVDVSKFAGYDELKNRFASEAMIPFSHEGGVWALPDTMAFYMLFYRKDILNELNIKIEDLKTWDSILKNVLPELQVNSLGFGVPVGFNSYVTFLYQNGGELYLNGGRNSALSNNAAVRTMEEYAKLYMQYGIPLAYDFANRFRSGEMPIAVVDYLQYNQLTVFAPEIKGLWSMLPVPGTISPDGAINQETVATYTASIILSNTKDKNSAFEFLKWWTSADTQLEYGANLESVVGSAARYNSANIDAINDTAWGGEIKTELNKQIKMLRSVPHVPGSYLTSRYYDFAFRDIVYKGENVKQTLIDAVSNIDAELAHKREEYNLD